MNLERLILTLALGLALLPTAWPALAGLSGAPRDPPIGYGPPTYRLRVEVRDAMGNPLPGCKVTVQSRSSPLNRKMGDGETVSFMTGERIVVTADPCGNRVLDHWVLDGSRGGTSKSVSLTMNADHTVRAVYRRRKSIWTPGAGGESPLADLSSWGHLAGEVDEERNADVLPSGGPNSLILGGPLVHAEVPAVPDESFWEGLWVELESGEAGGVGFLAERGYYVGLSFGGETHRADYGRSDYCAAVLLWGGDGGYDLYAAGVTRYGTRACLLWSLENPSVLWGRNFALLSWSDSNGDGEVQLTEVSVLASGWAWRP